MTPMRQELKRPLDIRHPALIGHSQTRIRRLFDSSGRRIKAQHTPSAGTRIFDGPQPGSLPKALARHMIYLFCVARRFLTDLRQAHSLSSSVFCCIALDVKFIQLCVCVLTRPGAGLSKVGGAALSAR